MLEKIKKIWKDPVISKVISVGIVGLLILIYNYINSKIGNTTFKGEFIKFWTLKFEIWKILVFLTISLTIYFLSQSFKKFNYDEETLKLDRDFFIKIRDTYLTEGMMLVPKSNGFSSNAFSAESLHRILEVREESKKSSFEFINPKLEKKKNEVINEIQKLYEVTSKHIFGTNNSSWLSIPREWAHDDRERFDKAWKEILMQENLLTLKYDDLIKTGRRTLKI